MDGIDMIVNSLPAPTWEKLGMNRANIKDFTVGENCMPADIPHILKCGDSSAFDSIETGMGSDFTNALMGLDCFLVNGAGRQRFDLKFTAVASTAKMLIDVPENAESTVIMDYQSVNASVTGNVLTLAKLSKNAKLNLIQVVRAGEKFRLFNDIGADLEDNAQINMTQIFVSAGEVFSGFKANLFGRESSMETHIGYNVCKEQMLDMNYIANQVGKNTESRIVATGALKDNAYKIFRGTIDFVKGCAGSIGNETEDVLIIDDGVVNKTIPLILCAEEDVEGNHGASIGRPDEEIMFYLASRGIDEADGLRMLTLAKLDEAAMHIQDERYRTEILRFIHGEEA